MLAVHLHKADFASACLEVSIALKCSNPSSTFRQPFLTRSRAAVPAGGRADGAAAHVRVWVGSAVKTNTFVHVTEMADAVVVVTLIA